MMVIFLIMMDVIKIVLYKIIINVIMYQFYGIESYHISHSVITKNK